MDVSFVILTWNSESYLEKCFDSLISHLATEHLDYEIFIIDNGSTDKTVDLLKNYQQQYPKLEVIYLPDNIGTTRSRNMGLKKCCGDYVCIMDSDVEIKTPVFKTLIETLESVKNIGLVAPKIFYPSGKWQKSIDQFPTLLHKLKRFLFLRKIEEKEGELEIDVDREKPVDYAISAFWLFKKEILEKVGLLDKNFFYAPEDVDYCLRVWQAGYEVVYQPEAEVVHHTQEISRGLKINKAKKEHLKGLAYFFKKHGFLFRRPFFSSAVNPDRKVLFVAYQFPPIAGPATQRHLRFVTRLKAFNWSPVILTVKPENAADYVPIDYSSVTDQLHAFTQVRAGAFNPLDFLLRFKARFTNRPVSGAPNVLPVVASGSSTGIVSSRKQVIKDFITDLFRIPDMMNGWIPFAVVKGLMTLRKHQCKLVYASGGPWSSFLVGYCLSVLGRRPLICDFRDPWVRNPYHKKKAALIERLETYLERLVVHRAFFVIANTERLLIDFRKHYKKEPAEKFVHISNGYDERLFNTDKEEHGIDKSRLTVRHVGSLYGPRTPVTLLQVLSQMKKDNFLSSDNFCLEFVGRVDTDSLSEKILTDLDIADIVTITPPVSHTEAIRLIKSADVLLIVQPDTDLQIPGKLFEYMAARKTVFALACPGATAELIEQEGIGLIAEMNDRQKIGEGIRFFLSTFKSGELDSAFKIDNLSNYESRFLTKKLVNLFNQVLNVNDG